MIHEKELSLKPTRLNLSCQATAFFEMVKVSGLIQCFIFSKLSSIDILPEVE